MATVHSFALKLERAREHLKIFEDESKRWVETKPYDIIDEADPDPLPHPFEQTPFPHRRFRVGRIDPVPDRLSLIVGDCLFNIRSSLDHLALSLAMSNTPGMTIQQIRSSEFPITGANTLNLKDETNKIGCVSAGARSTIKALQPSIGGNAYASHPLWQIHDLNRIDKHRTLIVQGGVPRGEGKDEWVGFRFIRSSFDRLPSEPTMKLRYAVGVGSGLLKRNAILFRYGTVDDFPYHEKDFQPDIPLKVAFGDGTLAKGEPVVPFIHALCDFVRDAVISPLSQFL